MLPPNTHPVTHPAPTDQPSDLTVKVRLYDGSLAGYVTEKLAADLCDRGAGQFKRNGARRYLQLAPGLLATRASAARVFESPMRIPDLARPGGYADRHVPAESFRGTIEH